MRRLLLLFSVLFFAEISKAQVVFCPPGAEWHYLYFSLGNVKINEEIKYVRDSSLNSETVKVLQHKRFFKWQNYYGNKLTVIKQKGDTVFFRSLITQHTWQVLYNYAALPGQSWENQIKLINPIYATTLVTTHTLTVDSIKDTIVNSINLRTLFIKMTSTSISGSGTTGSANFRITERFGCNEFMFNFYNLKYVSDADWFEKFLCYKDDVFAQVQFTETDCYYSNPLGVNGKLKIKDDGLKIYPNPSSDLLNVELVNKNIKNYTLKLTNILGEEERFELISKQENSLQLNVSQLKNGIYFLQVFDSGKLMYTEKIVKE